MATVASPLGRVYLIGAGPGDPELLTLRGLRRLREADLVLYDALVHPEILESVPNAECVFVGKRAGRPSARQSEINRRLLEATSAGRTVARIKGGDPYLFGRGSEEAEFCAEHDIPFEVIPGVPSPLAVSAYAGISLTHRQRSSSVLYLTATESVEKDRTSHDWARLATGPETLVIFMGTRKIKTLMALLMEHGRAADTPVAVVQHASRPLQRTVEGTVGTIAAQVREVGLGLPSLIVVGEVVELRDTLRWYDRQPLFGKRVLVTRPAHQKATLARGLRDRGAEPFTIPTIRIVPPEDTGPLSRAVAETRRYRWVVFTSANGVRAFFEEVARQGLDSRVLAGAKVCAIGPATAAALEVHGIRADLMPQEYRGEAAAAAVLDAGAAPEDRVLIPRAQVAREALPRRLADAGLQVDVVPAYRTLGAGARAAERLRELIFHRKVDVLAFTSPSTAQRLADALGEGRDAVSEGFVVAAIGPVTAAAVRKLGWPVHVEASTYTTDGLLDALTEFYTAP